MSPPSIEIEDGAFLIEASVITTGLDVEPAQVLILFRSGEITSISEQGVGEDAGFRFRSTGTALAAKLRSRAFGVTISAGISNQLHRLAA